MGQIDVADGKPPGHKRHISRVELFLHPVGPDPVQIVLNGPGVDQSARMKNDAGPQQLERLLYFGRLGKAAQAGHQVDGIDHAVGARRPLYQKFPGYPVSQHDDPFAFDKFI